MSENKINHLGLRERCCGFGSKKKAKMWKCASTTTSEEVSSKEWKDIKMSEQEEDLIRRMYKLVGDKWNLIAGRIPGRKPEEIERFWIMRHTHAFSHTPK